MPLLQNTHKPYKDCLFARCNFHENLRALTCTHSHSSSHIFVMTRIITCACFKWTWRVITVICITSVRLLFLLAFFFFSLQHTWDDFQNFNFFAQRARINLSVHLMLIVYGLQTMYYTLISMCIYALTRKCLRECILYFSESIFYLNTGE